MSYLPDLILLNRRPRMKMTLKSKKKTNYVNSVQPIFCRNILEFLSLEDKSET